VLLTRPAEAAGETASRLREMGFAPVLAPLLHIRPLSAELPAPEGLQAVLVTSARALPVLDRTYHHVRLLAVGDATASYARQAGHLCVESAGGNAGDLHRLVRARCDPDEGTLLLLSGQGEGVTLANALRRAFRLEHHFVYASEPVACLPEAASAALRGDPVGGGVGAVEVVAALFFSAATARAFVTLAEAAGLRDTIRQVLALAISAETAAALAVWPWREVRVARRPNQDKLLDLLR
jgi:uroporphyrinogen-III synthase